MPIFLKKISSSGFSTPKNTTRETLFSFIVDAVDLYINDNRVLGRNQGEDADVDLSGIGELQPQIDGIQIQLDPWEVGSGETDSDLDRDDLIRLSNRALDMLPLFPSSDAIFEPNSVVQADESEQPKVSGNGIRHRPLPSRAQARSSILFEWLIGVPSRIL